MKRSNSILCCGLLAAFLSGVPVEAEIVRLEDGSWIQGEILSHTEEEFRFQRWDTRGTITLRWDQIREEDAARIQKTLGYVSEEDLKETEAAVRILTLDGRIYEGKRLADEDGVVRIKTTYRVIEIPIESIKRRQNGSIDEPIELDLGKIYTKQEIYEKKLAELEERNVEQDAKVQAHNHYLFSEWLSRIGFLDEARFHLVRSMELASENRNRFAGRLEDLDRSITEAGIEGRFRNVRTMARRKRFPEAFAELDLITTEVPAEDLTRDVQGERDWVQQEMDRVMIEEVPDQFFRALRDLTRTRARDRDVSLDEAMQYASGELGEEVVRKVAVDLRLEEAAAGQYFAQRESRYARTASFGSGTFLVGSDRSSGKGGGAGGAGAGGGGAEGGGRGGLEGDVGEILEMLRGGAQGGGNRQGRGGQRGNGQGRGGQAEQVDPRERWWAGSNTNQRGRFLYAYYCLENFEVEKNTYNPCSNCGGRGIETFMRSGVLGGSTRVVPCPRCQGEGYDRTIHFK